jgi:hypothetical protein
MKTDREEVKSLSPLLINTIWSVLNASRHEKRKRQTERERERERDRQTDCQESYTQLSNTTDFIASNIRMTMGIFSLSRQYPVDKEAWVAYSVQSLG